MGLPWQAANMEGCSRAQLLAVSVLASGLAAFLAVLHSLRTSPRPGAAFSPMPSGHAIDSYRGTSMAALSSMTRSSLPSMVCSDTRGGRPKEEKATTTDHWP